MTQSDTNPRPGQYLTHAHSPGNMVVLVLASLWVGVHAWCPEPYALGVRAFPRKSDKDENELLRLEKRALSIITSWGREVPQQLGIRPMLDHYELLCQKRFNTILDEPCHKRRAILPPLHDDSRCNPRKQHHFNTPRLRTDRARNTFSKARKFNLKFS